MAVASRRRSSWARRTAVVAADAVEDAAAMERNGRQVHVEQQFRAVLALLHPLELVRALAQGDFLHFRGLLERCPPVRLKLGTHRLGPQPDVLFRAVKTHEPQRGRVAVDDPAILDEYGGIA